jgi:DNA-damage-inducible protein J
MIARKQTSIKVDPVAWEEAKKIFKEYGITASDAINIFLNEVRLKGGLPFSMRLPKETLNAIKDARENKNMIEMDLNSFRKLLDETHTS